MNEIKTLIDDTLNNEVKQSLNIYMPKHISQLLDDVRGIGRMVEAMNYICQHYPRIFEIAYEEVVKNDSR